MSKEKVKRQYVRNKQNYLIHAEDNDQVNEDILTFDLESHEWINFIVLGFYHLDKDHYVYFTTMKEAVSYMFSYCEERGLKNIFGHFAGKFDFNFILHSIYNDFDKDDGFTLTRAIPRGSGLLSMSLKRESCSEDKDSFELTFNDSSALFPMGLASLASMMKVETQKGTCDFRYILKAWNNEDYKNILFDDVYTNEFAEEVVRNEVYVDGKKLTKKTKNRVNLVDTKRVTYKSNEDGKIHIIYNKQDVLDYLKDDCVSLAQSIKKFYEMPFIKKSKKAKTIAGQAVNVFRTYLPLGYDFYIPKSKSIEDTFVREGYFGGRTEIFKMFFSSTYDIENNPYNFGEKTLIELRKQAGKTLKCYDVNSLYPTCMLNIFPLHCIGLVKGKRNYDKYKWGMWKVKMQVPNEAHIPFFGKPHTVENGTTKLCFTKGEFDGCWTKEEIEYGLSIGYKVIEYKEGIVYDTADYIFKDFIQEMYAMRLQAQRDGDEPTRGIVKLIMNSTYGKLGMRVDDKVYIKEFKHDECKIHREIVSKKGKIYLGEVESDTRNIFHKVIIPAYVTAYARVLMHKLMIQCGEDTIYYTDTDSIFTTVDIKTGDELGDLKLEYESKEAVFLMPKTYSIDDIINAVKYKGKITMKGFDSRKVKSFTHQNLVDFKFGELQSLKAYDPEKFLTPKSAFQKHTFLGMARSTKDEEKRNKEYIMALRKEKHEASKNGEIVLVEKIEMLINREIERYNKIKPINYKEIKSQYDKRILCEDQINTVPITLGVIDGKYESEARKSRSKKSSSKYGPEFEEREAGLSV